MTSRAAHNAGFTLAEVLAAMSLIAVALLATTAALQYGLSGIEIGRGESSAVLLIEHKLEELKAVALVTWADPALEPACCGCPPTGGASRCSAMPTPAAFRRTTTITAGSGGHCTAECKFVMVSVFYRPITVLGQLNAERRVDVGAIFVART